MVSVQASPITPEDRVFSTVELQALLAIHGNEPSFVAQLLALHGLQVDTIDDPATRLSLSQWLGTLSSCCYDRQDPLLALRVGQQMHLTAYGMLGFSLLSCPSLPDALDIANHFGLLANLKHQLHLEVDGEVAHLYLRETFTLLGIDKYFSTLLESAKILTLLGDMLGHGFKAQALRLNFNAEAGDAQAISRALGVPVQVNCLDNCISFSRHYVDQPLPQSHAITHQSCKALCSAQLRELSQRYDLCYQIQKMLLASPDRIPPLPEVASRLHLSPRTLRRKLEAVGSSYNLILEDVRKKLAIRYLLDTPLTTEAISEKLSYSDAANFRHAFKRWTGTAPRAFRSQNREIAWSMPPAFALPGASGGAMARAHA
ncbi:MULTISPECIES: AraC family transcriptional regulator [unclassified Pseudomonas]|uniref:AraC family transcriptional regulator n=1 Tax=unclassified Pseudomonas TaxID=196821 RepID=UPI0025EC1923|nr:MULTISPECIES: AraC family transcriptional regulator [unclassified Pseudomonas]